MTLYYSLVFALLLVEMLIFLGLIVPLPLGFRRRIFNFLATSIWVAKAQYALKITFIFILILFLDSVNRVYRVELELAATKTDNRGGATMISGHDRTEVLLRKFYSQRNMYLCGFTLFLSLVLNRLYGMSFEVLRLQEERKSFKAALDGQGGSKTADEITNNSAETESLRKELADRTRALDSKERELQILKKQAHGLSAEYNRLGDQFTSNDGSVKKDR